MAKKRLKDNKNEMFVSPHDVLGYNAYLHFINSPRGLRKSHNYLKWCCERYIKTGEQFAYTRRSKTEIDEASSILFTGLEKYKDFPAGSFRIVGDKIIFNRPAYEAKADYNPKQLSSEEAPRDKKFKIKVKDRLAEGDEEAGYLFSISTAANKKSNPYPNVANLIYDEYLNENFSYLRNEPIKFSSLLETVFRDREKVRIFCLGNNISEVNPYYAHFKVKPSQSEITFFKDKGIIIQNAIRQAFKTHKAETPIGKILKGTEYYSHIVDNTALADNKGNCLKVNQANMAEWWNVILDGKKYGIWGFLNEGKAELCIYFSKNLTKMPFISIDKQIYTTEGRGLRNETPQKFKKRFERYVVNNKVFFEDLNIKQNVLPFLI